MKLPAGQALFLAHSETSKIDLSLKNILPPKIATAHPSRQRDWLTSRQALKNLFEMQGENISVEQLAHGLQQSLTAFPEFKYSLSHSEAGALVWLVPKNAKLNVGVDLESENREIQEGLDQRIRTEQDDKKLKTLELWSLKEAIYKSLLPSQQMGLAFSEIYVLENEFFIPLLSVKGSLQQTIENGNILSFAWFSI